MLCLVCIQGCSYAAHWRRVKWIKLIDLNRYAESNNIVVLYPQAKGDRKTGTGCWNWGFSKDDPLFDSKQGLQLTTVMNMLNDLDNAIARSKVRPDTDDDDMA